MKANKTYIGEAVLLFSSILIFRSVWTMLDNYLGLAYLLELAVIGVLLMLLALFILNREVECKIKELKAQQ
ncbi:MAG: hypothetical protein WHS82_00550 [Candidatus Methanosuratincola sp.]